MKSRMELLSFEELRKPLRDAGDAADEAWELLQDERDEESDVERDRR